MARINLLPWREELRKQQQQHFFVSMGAAVLLTIGILVGVHLYIEALTDHQNRRNQMLQEEITQLDFKLKEVKDIENKKNQLLTKIELIQSLQQSRPQIVHLFDELSKTAPDGVYLTQFAQTRNRLVMNGKAKSNARISAYMRAIDASPWLKDSKLNVIRKDKDDESDKMSDFVMLAVQGEKQPE